MGAAQGQGTGTGYSLLSEREEQLQYVVRKLKADVKQDHLQNCPHLQLDTMHTTPPMDSFGKEHQRDAGLIMIKNVLFGKGGLTQAYEVLIEDKEDAWREFCTFISWAPDRPRDQQRTKQQFNGKNNMGGGMMCRLEKADRHAREYAAVMNAVSAAPMGNTGYREWKIGPQFLRLLMMDQRRLGGPDMVVNPHDITGRLDENIERFGMVSLACKSLREEMKELLGQMESELEDTVNQVNFEQLLQRMDDNGDAVVSAQEFWEYFNCEYRGVDSEFKEFDYEIALNFFKIHSLGDNEICASDFQINDLAKRILENLGGGNGITSLDIRVILQDMRKHKVPRQTGAFFHYVESSGIDGSGSRGKAILALAASLKRQQRYAIRTYLASASFARLLDPSDEEKEDWKDEQVDYQFLTLRQLQSYCLSKQNCSFDPQLVAQVFASLSKDGQRADFGGADESLDWGKNSTGAFNAAGDSGAGAKLSSVLDKADLHYAMRGNGRGIKIERLVNRNTLLQYINSNNMNFHAAENIRDLQPLPGTFVYQESDYMPIFSKECDALGVRPGWKLACIRDKLFSNGDMKVSYIPLKMDGEPDENERRVREVLELKGSDRQNLKRRDRETVTIEIYKTFWENGKEEWLIEMFRKYDVNRDDKISSRELQHFLTECLGVTAQRARTFAEDYSAPLSLEEFKQEVMSQGDFAGLITSSFRSYRENPTDYGDCPDSNKWFKWTTKELVRWIKGKTTPGNKSYLAIARAFQRQGFKGKQLISLDEEGILALLKGSSDSSWGRGATNVDITKITGEISDLKQLRKYRVQRGHKLPIKWRNPATGRWDVFRTLESNSIVTLSDPRRLLNPTGPASYPDETWNASPNDLNSLQVLMTNIDGDERQVDPVAKRLDYVVDRAALQEACCACPSRFDENHLRYLFRSEGRHPEIDAMEFHPQKQERLALELARNLGIPVMSDPTNEEDVAPSYYYQVFDDKSRFGNLKEFSDSMERARTRFLIEKTLKGGSYNGWESFLDRITDEHIVPSRHVRAMNEWTAEELASYVAQFDFTGSRPGSQAYDADSRTIDDPQAVNNLKRRVCADILARGIDGATLAKKLEGPTGGPQVLKDWLEQNLFWHGWAMQVGYKCALREDIMSKIKQENNLPKFLFYSLAVLLLAMFLFQTSFGRSTMVGLQRWTLRGSRYEAELKEALGVNVKPVQSPLSQSREFQANADRAVKDATGAFVDRACGLFNDDVECTLYTESLECNGNDANCKKKQAFAKDCNYAKKCTKWKAPAKPSGSVFVRDTATLQKIEEEKKLLCANIVPSTICSQCGDSRTDYCKLIAFCDMETDCAPGRANTGYDLHTAKLPEAEINKKVLNVRIRTKGVCPGASLQGDETTVQIELENISNTDDIKEQLLTQINAKLVHEFGNSCSFKVQDIAPVNKKFPAFSGNNPEDYTGDY